MDFTYHTLAKEDINLIEPLWQELIDHLKEHTNHHQTFFNTRKFPERIAPFLTKIEDGTYLILLVKDKEHKIGYAFSSITKDGIAELDSIFVKPQYRTYAIGKTLMEKTLQFFDENKTKKELLKVSEGNEAVLSFYNKFGFEIESYHLERKK